MNSGICIILVIALCLNQSFPFRIHPVNRRLTQRSSIGLLEERLFLFKDKTITDNEISMNGVVTTALKKCAVFLGCFLMFITSSAYPVLAKDSASFSNERKMSKLYDRTYEKALINVQSDDFWYPPYMAGKWKTKLSFKGAEFDGRISLDTLLKEKHRLPGNEKYSIAFFPDVGKSIDEYITRYISLDSHVKEDHSFNVRQLMTAFQPEVEVISAKFNYQKAPDWFHSPANHWNVEYKNNKENGNVEFLTQKRYQKTFAGTIETTEFIQQRLTRIPLENPLQMPEITVSDYAINWKLSSPASLRDDFITVEALSRSNELVGTVDILVYLQPTDELYLKYPSKPIGVYSYDVSMTRINSVEDDTKQTNYPFVWRDVGPVELVDYFGY